MKPHSRPAAARIHEPLGGMAQGIGQALKEKIVYDQESAQLLTSSFMDYAMPRVSDLPLFYTGFIETPAPSNPLGVKGGSESGAIGAPAAIGNAVIDALWHLGVRDITLPITAEKVWHALKAAREQAITSPYRRAISQ
jgi:carbon-monoxide dehydrogenase large subunit